MAMVSQTQMQHGKLIQEQMHSLLIQLNGRTLMRMVMVTTGVTIPGMIEIRRGWEFVDGATNQDACPTQPGSSTEMMIYGCVDEDDGWSDTMDAFPSDETQYLDSDGDGYGDNPDGNQADDCRMVLLLITLQSIDLVVLILMVTDTPLTSLPMMVLMSIHLTQQWSNTDGDNYADQNEDDCGLTPLETSLIDRLGCLDTDGDGLSDPDECGLLRMEQMHVL